MRRGIFLKYWVIGTGEVDERGGNCEDFADEWENKFPPI